MINYTFENYNIYGTRIEAFSDEYEYFSMNALTIEDAIDIKLEHISRDFLAPTNCIEVLHNIQITLKN